MKPPPCCVYCGGPAAFKRTRGGHVQLTTCASHSDLPDVDPSYGLAETIAKGAYPMLDTRDRAPSSMRTERP